MATIKLKFRPSTVQGKAGTLCYQLCHRQENRQITTDMRIFPEWWNETKRELVTVPGNERSPDRLPETGGKGDAGHP